MKGLMMHRPLRIADILSYAAEIHPTGEIVSVRTEGDIHRTTYAGMAPRVARLAHALRAQGMGLGDRVATLAWNGYRHLELYYAISGIGAVCHTINPRLSAEQMLYIIGHAGDRMLFLDLTFVPLIEKLKDHLQAARAMINYDSEARIFVHEILTNNVKITCGGANVRVAKEVAGVVISPKRKRGSHIHPIEDEIDRAS